MEKCALCHQPGSKQNPINSHHVQTRQYSAVTMRVHSRGCHQFCDWITQEFALRGALDILSETVIVYFYGRAVRFRKDGVFGWDK